MSRELSIIVPVYNEEATVRSIVSRLITVCASAQIIYVDDGSQDGSLSILRSLARPTDLVLTKENGGKGSAVALGLEHAGGRWTVIQDADLEYDPADIALLLADAQQHPGSAVFGSRFLKPNPNLYKRYLLGNKAITAALNLLFDAALTDSYTCYKLLPTDLFQALNLQSRGFELEAEIAAKCLQRGIPIREIPVSYAPRRLEEGKKIRGKDAWKGLKKMLAIRYGE